jgi:putative transporter
MAQVYLNPLSSVAMAAYSIWQNLLNSLQLMRESKRQSRCAREQKIQ